MSIYSNDQIVSNWLYGEVMMRINDLYADLMEPSEFSDDETRTNTTTGNYQDPFWRSDEIGEWDGDEEEVAKYANSQLEEVYAELGIFGNGGIYNYYIAQEWAEFVEKAEGIIEDFHQNDAYEKLCECYEKYVR